MTRRWNLCLVLTLLLAVTLAGCRGSSPGARSGVAASATPTTTPVPTLAASPTSQPIVTPGAQPCADSVSKWAGVTRAGDLLLGPTFTNPEAILYQLPDGTPLQPLKVPPESTTGQFPGWPTSTLGANMLYVTVCNASATTSHTIQGARVKLAGFTAYSGQLSEWDFCAGFYARPAGVSPNNCDRGTAPVDEQLQAAFAPSAQVGTVISASPSTPAVLPPEAIMYIAVSLTAPTAPGTYSFALAVTADGAPLPFTGATSMLLAPVVHVWNGQACTSASMLTQIPPATNPPTPYICPVS